MKTKLSFLVAMVLVSVNVGLAQSTSTNPDDKPAISVGGTLFTDYTYTAEPAAVDSDGNKYHPSAFNVTRSYININGRLSHLVSFRMTPDITRETGTGSSLNGSLNFRVKYAFGQVNLDDWLPKGSFVRLGIQQTPYVDYAEGIYRYRFQGTMFIEREGFASSSDAGLSFFYNIPSSWGDMHIGYYNGENYSRVEVNDQKSFQARVSVRPLRKTVPGLRLTGFYIDDHYVKNAGRSRLLGNITFQHKRGNVGLEYLAAKDQPSGTRAELQGKGYSLWATPKLLGGFEGLLRYDRFKPNQGG